MRLVAVCRALLVLSWILQPALGAEADTALPSRVFEEVIDVGEIHLEVVVEDRKGRRVENLRREDFRLLVDGEETLIDFFQEIRQADPSSKPKDSAQAQSELGTGTPGSAGQESAESRGTSYLLFIDELFVSVRDRNRVLRELSSQLGSFGPEDRMAVVTFDGVDLVSHSSGTTSVHELRTVLERITSRRAQGQSMQQILKPLQAGSLPQEAEGLAFEMTWRLKEMAAAAAASLRAHAGQPGRKVMLLVAGDWPLSPIRYAYNSLDKVGERQEERILEPIYRTANLLGYTLYPIDAQGIQISGAVDVTAALPPSARRSGAGREGASGESASGESASGESASGQGFDRETTSVLLGSNGPTVVRNLREEESHASFRWLAAKTGGQPLLDSSRLTAFRKVTRDTRHYYWLGYAPDLQGDNENHELKVEVLRPGLRVRHRLSYQDLSRDAEASFLVESALLLGELPGRELRTELGEAKPVGRRLEVPVRLFIPLDEITFLPGAAGQVAELQLRIAAVDEKGRRSQVDLLPVTLAMKSAPAPGGIGVQEVAVQLRKIEQDLVFSLLDPVSGRSLSAKHHFLPSEPVAH